MQTINNLYNVANLTIDKWQLNVQAGLVTLVVHDTGTPSNIWTIELSVNRVQSGDKTPTVS